MERVLKEMQELIARLDLNRALEFGTFSEVFANFYMYTPVRNTDSAPNQSPSAGLGSLLKPPTGPALSQKIPLLQTGKPVPEIAKESSVPPPPEATKPAKVPSL